MAREISYEVVEKLGVISTKEFDRTVMGTKNKKEHVVKTKELRRVKWGDNEPKLEIRFWEKVGDEETAGKGITLDDDEIDTLNFILESIDPAAKVGT